MRFAVFFFFFLSKPNVAERKSNRLDPFCVGDLHEMLLVVDGSGFTGI